MIAVVFAVLAAASNAVASVLQRRANRTVPSRGAFRIKLIWYLIRRPVWLGGFAAMIAGFVFQAGALFSGGLSLVQPILTAELPFTMILVARLSRIGLGRRSWLAVGELTVGLAVLLAAAAPEGGHHGPKPAEWIIVSVLTVGTITALVIVGTLMTGASRTALLGVAAGFGFSFTATFIKESTYVFDDNPGAFLTTWPPYAMAVAGVCSLYLLQNALRSGSLVAAQPALTVSDPVASIVYGVMLFDERIRTGPWTIPEAVGVGLILYGSIRLAQSSAIRANDDITSVWT